MPETQLRISRPGAQLRIIRPGLFSTVQDLGRFGFQRFGMPVSGAMDPIALRAGNRLVGNPDEAAGLEFTITGPDIAFDCEALIAVTGADLSPAIDGTPTVGWTAISVAAGSVLSFGPRRSGARAYLAVAGGIDVPVVLGSRSTHTRSLTGGLAGRSLAAGDILRGGIPASGSFRFVGRTLPASARPQYDAPRLRVILGPQVHDFTTEAVDVLLGETYTLSSEADRMGYRLRGAPLPHRGAADIISDATPAGSVQVPANQEPILLMADHQTTGGYPKIAVVISADLPVAAQLMPGDSLRFSLVDAGEASGLIRTRYAELDAALPRVAA